MIGGEAVLIVVRTIASFSPQPAAVRRTRMSLDVRRAFIDVLTRFQKPLLCPLNKAVFHSETL